MRTFACLLLLLSISTPALAALSGADLLKRCTASEKSMHGEPLTAEESLDSMWCIGYLSGMLDGFGVGDYKVGDEKFACPGEAGVTRSEALGITVKYLREHPDDIEKSGRRSLLLALAKAFPCK